MPRSAILPRRVDGHDLEILLRRRFTVELDEGERHRTGRMVEYDATEHVFTTPSDKRTEAYVTGRFG